MDRPAATPPRVWVEIDLDTLAANYRHIEEAVSPAIIMAVLKSDAYGLGCHPIAEALARAGVRHFGVAEPNEAFQLLDLGLSVQILGSVLPSEIPELVRSRVVLPVTDYHSAALISEEAGRQGTVACGHIKIDSGMGRLGIPIEGAVEKVLKIRTLSNLRCEGIYTHFPMAYRRDDGTSLQKESFLNLLRQLESMGCGFDLRHCANSDAINNFPDTACGSFNMVRSGINLHGSFDAEGYRRLRLKSTLTLKTRLVARRRLAAGSTIGYGCTYRLPEDTDVGTISAGYSDGLPLALSNRGYVTINGAICPVLGRVSMDYTTISLSQAPTASIGDEVICLGGGSAPISVESWAQLKGTHPYEIICSFGKRVKRCYTIGGKNSNRYDL